MIKYIILMISIVCLVVSCAHGPIGSLPKIDNPEEAAELIIIRNNSIIGATNSYKITLNKQDILAIRVGEYTKFQVKSGNNSLGVKCFGGWSPTWKHMNIDVSCKPGNKYYFLISPGGSCAKIEPLKEEDGLKWISESKYFPVEK